MQPIIDRSYLVELNLGSVGVGKQIFFNFVPQLENVEIYGVQTVAASQLNLSPNGNVVVTNSGLSDLVVTLAVQDTQDVYFYPATDLCSLNTYGFIRAYNNKRFNITKSFVTILSTANIANNESIIFNFIYRTKK